MKTLLIAMLVFAISPIAFGQVNLDGMFTIMTPPSVQKIVGQQATLKATFVVRIDAIDDDFVFTPANFKFDIYRNGVKIFPDVVSFTTYDTPSAGVSVIGPDTFKIQNNNMIDLPVHFQFTGPTSDSGFLTPATYAIGLGSIAALGYWNGSQIVDSMDGDLGWRTSGIVLGAGDITVTAIPEPSTWTAIAGAGVLGIAFLKRRRPASSQCSVSAC